MRSDDGLVEIAVAGIAVGLVLPALQVLRQSASSVSTWASGSALFVVAFVGIAFPLAVLHVFVPLPRFLEKYENAIDWWYYRYLLAAVIVTLAVPVAIVCVWLT